MKIMPKPWIIGFTEAEGSLYLVQKSPGRIAHGFLITQKLDRIVLESIAYILRINVTDKPTYADVGTTAKSKIPYIIEYYANTMKGMKSIEYRIWARSFLAKASNTGHKDLLKVQQKMRKLRSIRLDKNFKI
jgi:hypothetical protein